MDLRVYVDGVARIICDLTRTTTVHDIIIALAQYKGKAGRYSLIECAPDGTQRILSPSELTCELAHHADWTYILRQNPSHRTRSVEQKRSKSLDGRKTPVLQQQQQLTVPPVVAEIPSLLALSSSSVISDPFRTVHSGGTLSSSQKTKRRPINPFIPTSSNANPPSSPLLFVGDSRRSSRTPTQPSAVDQQRSRPKSALPSTLNETSAFRLVPHPHHNQQQHQYVALLKLLKSQEHQVEQQKQDLNGKDQEIQYRESCLYQTQMHQEELQHDLQRLEEHDRRLLSECQLFAVENSPEKLDIELEIHRQLHTNYEHLQQQVARCSTTLESKQQLQEQLRLNIDQTHRDIEQMQTNATNEKKEISQCQQELEHSNVAFQQHEDLVHMTTQRANDLEHLLQQRRQQVHELESELGKLDEQLGNIKI